MVISSVGTNVRIDRVELLRHPRIDFALDPCVRGQRKSSLSLQVLQDDVRLANHQLLAQDELTPIEVNVVQLVVLER